MFCTQIALVKSHTKLNLMEGANFILIYVYVQIISLNSYRMSFRSLVTWWYDVIYRYLKLGSE